MVEAGHWKVEFHDDFEKEFEAFTVEVQTELLASAKAVQRLGPKAGRPHVATLANARHPNMKELRFNAHGATQVWRAAFAFDPDRRAVVLVAADKQGLDPTRFYKELLRKANDRFDRHLASFKNDRPVSTIEPAGN
ncbi:type II toxin-antitoxin system RelE/ParE family toxin [Roseateles terrae]|uniref:type II toxin-antitoxin system RelE/ParE family toxin n=1 Tax=Roseateles terrae TaxID=431060 RepID=UPI000B4CA9FD|nr:type II toxin-antitoxin system RelE/ParE family toxin [Roseateles terrae]OWQ89737.1 hypothetical protein CDN98_04265 [Roseateles terrae]